MNERIAEYRVFLEEHERKLNKCRLVQKRLVIYRFLAFTGIVLCLMFLNFPFNIAPAFFLFALLLYFVRKNVQKENERHFLQRLLSQCRDEILALNEQYDQFDAGTGFSNVDHPFTYDLDVFARGGLFQFLNRTVSPQGKKKLAGFLENPLMAIPRIKERQNALEELGKLVRWRQYFLAKANFNNQQDLHLQGEISSDTRLKKPETIKWLIRLLPAFTMLVALLVIAGLLNWAALLLLGITNSLLISFHKKTIDTFYTHFGNQNQLLNQYGKLISQIEQQSFDSHLLNELKNKLSAGDKNASQVIRELQRILARFDYRANMLFIFTADPLILWDLICIYQLDRWQNQYHAELTKWFEAIAEMDALISLANYTHNHHSSGALPLFESGEFCFSGSNLAHPLLRSAGRIGNDFDMIGDGQIVILTGANMAGKSTFLRTLGINMILAMNGCRVCASSLTLKPVLLYTNMRTSDNLMKAESYFHAELLRLQHIFEQVKAGKPTFILIDEMLKGTNSIDKLEGSKELTKLLLRLNGNAIISTHDLKLTELKDFSKSKIKTLCFEINIENDNLIFDYKLQKGVTQTMNASFLMRKMGLIS